MVGTYRDRDRAGSKRKGQQLIDRLASGVPAALVEVRTLGRTLKQRAADVLAYFDRPGTVAAAASKSRARASRAHSLAVRAQVLDDVVQR